MLTPRFPAAFQPPPFASWPSCSRPDFRAAAYRQAVTPAGPRRAYHVPHLRDTSGLGRLLYPGAVVLPWLPRRRQPALPPPSGGPYTPDTHPITGAPLNGACTEVHHVHPPGLPLSCNRWMDHRPWDFLPGFTPHSAVLHDACRERGRASSTHPELSGHTLLHPSSSLERCDLVSHRRMRLLDQGADVRGCGDLCRPVESLAAVERRAPERIDAWIAAH